jgi:branched-subunit amino acid permease
MARPAYWWLVAGLAALAGAIIIPAVDGGELSEAWWSVMAGLFLSGIALLITGVVKMTSRRTGRGIT